MDRNRVQALLRILRRRDSLSVDDRFHFEMIVCAARRANDKLYVSDPYSFSLSANHPTTVSYSLNVHAQANDDVDDLVEDRRTDARPHQRGADAPDLGDHLRREVVIRDLAGGVIHDARAAEGRIHQDAGAERADDAADAVDAEHVERVVIAERILHHGAEEQADDANHETQHDRAHPTAVTGRLRNRDQA